jgi:hypothetical protein
MAAKMVGPGTISSFNEDWSGKYLILRY